MFLIALALSQVVPAVDAIAPPEEEQQEALPTPEAVAPLPPSPSVDYSTARAVEPETPWFMGNPPPSPPSRFSSTPKPRNSPKSWVGFYDYPLMAMLLKETGRSTFKVSVDAAGKVSDCTIIISSGFARLDQLTCKLVTRRARFNPAMDQNGRPVAGQYAQAVRWLIADPEPLRASDFGWKRPAEAKKLKQRGTVGFQIEISAEGVVTSCRITRSSGFALLDTETCKRLSALETASIALSEAGEPVARTVRSGISW